MNKILSLFKTNKKMIFNFLYTMFASIILQGTIHLIIYPYINYSTNSNTLGNIIFLMSIVNIFAQTFGNSLCNSRQILHKTNKTSNKDFNFILYSTIIITILIGSLIFSFYLKNLSDVILIVLTVTFTIIRYYSTVDYKLKLDFKTGFKYFSFICIGYILGLVLFTITNKWQYIFLIGELFALFFILIKGSIFKKDKKILSKKVVFKTFIFLAISYLLIELTTNFDRLIFKNLINAEAVSLYYVVSIIGKTLLLFTGPINSLTLSYLSNSKKITTKKEFIKIFGLYTMLSLCFYACGIIFTPVFAHIFYPNLYSEIIELNIIVNATQIINFAASLPLIYILSELGSKNHFKINLIYSILFIPSTFMCTYYFGFMGYIYASFVINIIKYLIIFLFGYFKFPKEQV